MFVRSLTDGLQMKSLRPPDSALFLPSSSPLPIFPSKLWSRLGATWPRQSQVLGAGLQASPPPALGPGVAEVQAPSSPSSVPGRPGHLPFLPRRSWASHAAARVLEAARCRPGSQKQTWRQGLTCRMYMPGWEGALGIDTQGEERKEAGLGRERSWAAMHLNKGLRWPHGVVVEDSRVWRVFQSCPEPRWRGQAFLFPLQQTLDADRPLEGVIT